MRRRHNEECKDVNAVDHSGNREYAGKLTDDEAAALVLADQLNKEERRIKYDR